MNNIKLSIGITSNPRTWPIIDGTVKAEGVDLMPTVLHPSELFWRQLRFAEFDVAEMSVSSLMMAKSKGDERFVGIPVFTTRMFFHTRILVRKDAKIDKPADLKGKRVGVPEYQQTAALWIRGALQHEFGVEPKDMEFWMERPPSKSHGGATGFKAPPGVTVNQVPPEKSLGSMMVSGELDAVMFYLVDPNLIDRSTIDLHNHPDIKPLFAGFGRRGRALLQEDRALSDQPRHGDEARVGREISLGADQHPEGLQAGRGAGRPPARSSTPNIISTPASCRRRRRRTLPRR